MDATVVKGLAKNVVTNIGSNVSDGVGTLKNSLTPWNGKKAVWRGVEGVLTVIMYGWGILFPDPEILDGPGAIKRLPATIKKNGENHVLVVTDKGLTSLGLLNGFYEALEQAGIQYTVFDGVQPNPSIENVEEGLAVYNANNCEAVVAVGGGSPIDCAKGIIARVARPNMTIKQMKGEAKLFIPLSKLNGYFPPTFYAVPTTAGTGSETTIATVITDTATQDKFSVMDPLIRARYAVLDPELTTGLPKKITSTTGLDALTHAVEGYTNIWYNNKQFNDYGVKAIKLIFENLETAYNEPENLEARGNMLLAAYYAGLCFTRGGVGYVHGIGHRLGGLYHVPHGLAMSVILTHVMSDELLGPYVFEKLAELGDAVGVTNEHQSAKQKADAFIAEIRAMEDRMDIPTGFDCIKDEDIPVIAERCIAEVNPAYPVPHIFSQEELELFIREHLQEK